MPAPGGAGKEMVQRIEQALQTLECGGVECCLSHQLCLNPDAIVAEKAEITKDGKADDCYEQSQIQMVTGNPKRYADAIDWQCLIRRAKRSKKSREIIDKMKAN